MEKLKNTPSLRFPEFNENWELKTLGEVGKIVTGLTYNPKDISTDGVLVLRSSNVKDRLIKLEDNVFVKTTNFNKVLNNDILICVRNGSKNLIGKNALINKNQEGLAFGAFMVIYRSKLNSFIFQLFDTQKYFKIINENLGATINSINNSDLRKFEFFFPTIQEQTKIASFLTVVDNKLQALKQKITLFKQYKKGVMQKIFSQEIRFKDDNGSKYPDWEEKKLGDCLDYIQPTKYLVSSTEYDNSYSTPVLTAGKTFILGYTNETNGIFENNLPVIIFDDFTTATQFVDFPFKAKSSAMKILVAKEGINIRFMYETMQIMKYELGGHERHWISKFAPLEILIPSTEEQTKIANFLSAIDDKIKHCQTQKEKTEVWKKGLLQQMFC